MSIGAPTGGAIWTEPVRPSLGITVGALRLVLVSPGEYAISDTGPVAGWLVDLGDGEWAFEDAGTASSAGMIAIAGEGIVFGGTPT